MSELVASGVVVITSMVVGSVLRSVGSYVFPGRRIAYDQDGTMGFLLCSESLLPDEKGTLIELPSGALMGMNGDLVGGLFVPGRDTVDEPQVIIPGIWGEATYPGARNFVVLFFAEPMRIRGWYATAVTTWGEHSPGATDPNTAVIYPSIELEASLDSTNGYDGKWNPLGTSDINPTIIQTSRYRDYTAVRTVDGLWVHDAGMYDPVFPLLNPFREEFLDSRESGRGWVPTFGAVTRNVRAIRFSVPASGNVSSFSAAMLLLHLYGEPDINAGSTRLAVVDPFSDAELIQSPSFGDVDHDGETTISMGIKNLSPVATATEVEVSIMPSYPDGNVESYPDPGSSDTLYRFGPSLDGFLQLSLDEQSWAETVVLGDLAPEQTVEVFARQSSAPGVVGLRFARVTVETEGWI